MQGITWKIININPFSEAVFDYLNAEMESATLSNSESFTIKKLQLSPFSTYKVGVTFKNYFNAEGTEQATFTT